MEPGIRSRWRSLGAWPRGSVVPTISSERDRTPPAERYVRCVAELCRSQIKAAPLRGAAARRQRRRSALGGPRGARRATHRRDPQTKVAQRATTGCSDEPSSPGSRLSRSRPPRQWRPYRTVARAVLDRQVPAITLRDPGDTAHPGLPPRTPASMGSAAPRFDHPAACAARSIASMKPARGHPAPRLQAGHLAHDDALDTTGEMCKGIPPFPPPGNDGSPPDGVKPVRARRATASGQSAWSTYTRRQA